MNLHSVTLAVIMTVPVMTSAAEPQRETLNCAAIDPQFKGEYYDVVRRLCGNPVSEKVEYCYGADSAHRFHIVYQISNNAVTTVINFIGSARCP